jgi:hypothetical protein
MTHRLNFSTVVACCLAVPLLGCVPSSERFTLYRNSVLDQTMRIHISTFDATDGEKYNAENCGVAANLFGSQVGVNVRYWCERGGFKK